MHAVFSRLPREDHREPARCVTIPYQIDAHSTQKPGGITLYEDWATCSRTKHFYRPHPTPGMDFWKLMHILHAKQLIMNPMRTEKLDRLCRTLNPPRNGRVIDIGCGKGELLHRLHALYGVTGVGIDKSSYCIEECRRQKQTRAPHADIEYLLMDGKDYQAAEEFDIASCMGASWIWGGIRGTLAALKELTKPGGLIVLGEPHWLREPDEEYLRLEGFKRGDFHSHMENALMGDDLGLTCVYTMASDTEDWDGYEAPHWWAAAEYADTNPDDPDLPEIAEAARKQRESYLRHGRGTVGWCLYIYRKPLTRHR